MRRALLYLLIAYTLAVDVAVASFIVSAVMHQRLPECHWHKPS